MKNKKVFLFTISFLFIIGNFAKADSFVKGGGYDRYEGGFTKATILSGGYHWTKYSVKGGASNGIWAQINVAGRGNTQDTDKSSAYAKSPYRVDFYHQHTHLKGILIEN